MKLACASSAFDEQFRSGTISQIEWIESVARDLAADGVVFDVRHFPRADSDYLAQVKKMAADLGLTVAALEDDAFFAADEAAMRHSLDIALAIGAPLLSGKLQVETQTSWSEALIRLNAATGLAKRANVTLAVRNAPGTFAGSGLDMKRVSKEADSAWLRYGLDVAALDAAADPNELAAKTVLAWNAVRPLGSYLGFIVVPGATLEETQNAIRHWRTAFADFSFDRT